MIRPVAIAFEVFGEFLDADGKVKNFGSLAKGTVHEVEFSKSFQEIADMIREKLEKEMEDGKRN